MEILIDGVRYVAATDAVPQVADVLRVLAEQWWGAGDAPGQYSGLRIIVSGEIDDAESGESFDEFAARLMTTLESGR